MSEYTKREILDGVECWLNPESDIWCENCPFHRVNPDGSPVLDKHGNGICKTLVLEEVRKVFSEDHSNKGTLGELLKETRIKKGYSVRELAAIVGVSHPTIYKYETNEYEPKLSHLKWLAQALDIPLADVIERI
jgi:DNA-binding XRE family transcriptional regulator